LVDAANRRYSQGEDKVEAVIAAARSRLVPIAMTSLATIVGRPDGAWSRGGHRVESNRWPSRWSAGFRLHAAFALPRSGDVPFLRAPAAEASQSIGRRDQPFLG